MDLDERDPDLVLETIQLRREQARQRRSMFSHWDFEPEFEEEDECQSHLG